MKKIANIIIIILFLAVAGFSSYGKELKVGYADIFRVINEYNKTKEYEEALEKKAVAKDKILQDKQEELRKMQDRLGALKGKAEEEEREKIIAAAREYNELERQIRLELGKERNEKMKELLEDITKVIEEYAQKNKFDFIFNGTALIYGDNSANITDIIIK